MTWVNRVFNYHYDAHDNTQSKSHRLTDSQAAPPGWDPAPPSSVAYKDGLFYDAPEDEFEAGENFCARIPVDPPRLLASDVVERIEEMGCGAWRLSTNGVNLSRFAGAIWAGEEKGGRGEGVISLKTRKECKDVCLMSDLPLMAGLYDTQGKAGVYYEVRIERVEGILAIGTACKPYPQYRLPGWNRLSAALHSDDLHIFFEDPNGGKSYPTPLLPIPSPYSSALRSGDTLGCGYQFASATLFFTYNGVRLPPAFSGVYVPRERYDVFAALGVQGEVEAEVNFGGALFQWEEGNEWAWRVEGHVGRMSCGSNVESDVLPSYQDAVGR